MALDPQLLEILACPEDKGPLLYFEDESSLYNPRLKRRYAVRDDIPIMLIDEAETVDAAEHDRLTAKAAADGISPTFDAAEQATPPSAAGSSTMAVDSIGFLDAVAGLPEQLDAAHELAGSLDLTALPKPDAIDSIAVLGMGGSGIAGDVLAAVGSALPVPVVVLKQYRTPAFVGPRTLVFAMSFSGDTEETLSMTRGAFDADAHVVTIASGGALDALAGERGGLRIPCPSDIPVPRAALGALVAPLFVSLFRMGILPEAHASLVKAQEQLKRRRDQCRPEVEGAKNPARELARRVGRTIPLVYGGGALGAVAARRFKNDVNENAKAPAFWAAYPELNHNEICAWGQHGDVTRQVFTLVQLRHGFEHGRLVKQIGLARELLDEIFVQVLEVEAEGEGRLAQVLDLMYLGTWASCYLALDNDVDPGPIDAIAQLKSGMGPLDG